MALTAGVTGRSLTRQAIGGILHILCPSAHVERGRPQRRRAMQGAQRWRTVLICLALAAATAGVYAQVRHAQFIVLDDAHYIQDNPHVNTGLTAANVRWAFTQGYVANWHPLTWLSHMLDVELFGVDSGAHHLVNVALHIINALLLFGVLYRMTGAPWRSAIVAALFALHPQHVESVAWAAERVYLEDLIGVGKTMGRSSCGRGITCTLTTSPSRPAAVAPASVATFTAATSPVTKAVTMPLPTLSQPRKVTLAAFIIASLASIRVTKPLVSIMPSASILLAIVRHLPAG